MTRETIALLLPRRSRESNSLEGGYMELKTFSDLFRSDRTALNKTCQMCYDNVICKEFERFEEYEKAVKKMLSELREFGSNTDDFRRAVIELEKIA